MIEVVALLAMVTVVHFLWPYLTRRGAAYSTSRKEATAWAFRQIGIAGKKVYDLGCGYGVVLALAKSMGAVPIGVEIDPVRWAICRLRCRCVTLLGDMFKVDLSDADVVYVFQWPSVNMRLAEKLSRELKPSAYVVSYMWEIPGLALVAKNPKLKIYIYRKNL
ncbi:MAG: class I SAM-dependent methyltransferase [Pyrobaculum sp.]